MESNDEESTPPTPGEFLEYPFEYVTRKRKGKRRGRSHTHRNKTDEQSSDDPIFIKVNEVIEEETIEDAPDKNECRISWDSQMKTQPEVETEEYSINEKVELIVENVKFPLPEESPLINTRALTKHAITYELERFEKHILFIFKHYDINGYKPNLSSEKDEDELKKTFSEFGFEVIVEKDLTKEELMNKLRDVSENDFTDYGCVAVAILTIGSKHGIIWAKDEPYSELQLIRHFKTDKRPTLVTKPKIFIIQASQGIEETKAVTFLGATFEMGYIRKDFDEELEPYTLPVESDMLILHSSYCGKPFYRNELFGSWFIQTLCLKINQLAPTHDLEAILMEVKYEVAMDNAFSENNEELLEPKKQRLKVPVTTSTLIRKLYLRKFGEESPCDAVVCHSDYEETVDQSVLDNGSLKKTSSFVFQSCSCFIEHFDYMKECLKYFIKDHPDDVIARSFYHIASTFENGVEFNSAKEKMLEAISQHLGNDRPNNDDLKYLHLYNKKIW